MLYLAVSKMFDRLTMLALATIGGVAFGLTFGMFGKSLEWALWQSIILALFWWGFYMIAIAAAHQNGRLREMEREHDSNKKGQDSGSIKK